MTKYEAANNMIIKRIHKRNCHSSAPVRINTPVIRSIIPEINDAAYMDN
jgi:hypothetical protein